MKDNGLAEVTARWVIIAGVALATAPLAVASSSSWDHYGADAGGRRYSTASEITPDNVTRLQTAWTFHTGELGEGFANSGDLTFEATPILIGRTLYLSTATGKVFAVDAIAGRERWNYDSQVDRRPRRSELASRGVSYWAGTSAVPTTCRERIFLATIDARLIALDVNVHPTLTSNRRPILIRGSLVSGSDVFLIGSDRRGV